MDEKQVGSSPYTMRTPLIDATERVNHQMTPTTEQGYCTDDALMTSPEPMSIVTSPVSAKGNVEYNCRSSGTDSRFGSSRNSTVSAASIVSNKGKRKTHVGPWQLGKTLGRGATSRVRLAKHAMTGQTAAVKIVSKKSAAIAQSESIAAMDRSVYQYNGLGARPMPSGIEREVVIMKLIEHPNVISLYDVWENRGELYLVLEYVEGGELFDYVSNNGPLAEEEAVRLFRQIIGGLGYCHRFNICHRDLKPENILLDAWHNVKLADFGMAALQPAGHWLNTSCGSPHYAAPEIIYGRKYRGDQADIWSCGIILYALLTGYLPFDGRDLGSTLRLVKKGVYRIPPELSHEAADLIRRILQQRPEDRISMQEMWSHPLLKKYEKLHQAMANHYIGPPPPLSTNECGSIVKSPHDVDIDILRNLQVLWHDAHPDALIERLTSSEPSYERMFYNALVRFRNEQLENYQGQPLEHSASDYHHISRGAHRGSRRTPNRPPSVARGRAELQIKGNNRRHGSTPRDLKSSATVESYDPFRSPRYRITAENPEVPKVAQVTIHRKPSGIRKKHQSLDGVQPPNTVEERPEEEEEENPPSSPFSVVKNQRTKVNSVKSFQSKTSQCSSRRRLVTSHTRRSTTYKRNVSFHHVRNRSQGSATARVKDTPPPMPADIKRQTSESSLRSDVDLDPFSDRFSSPLLPAQPTVVRGAGVTVKPCHQPRRSRDQIAMWRDDTRNVSHELSQICEEAFNGGSLSTNCTTSTCMDSETPATSVGMPTPEDSQRHIASNSVKRQCVGPTPANTLYRAAELEETRRRLIEHATQDGCEDIPAYLVPVVAHLGRLIEQDKLRQRQKPDTTDDKTTPLTDPFANPPSDTNCLPIISEEMNPNADPRHATPSAREVEQRTASESTVRKHPSTPTPTRGNKKTVRMVPQSSFLSIGDIKPLNIRKKRDTYDSEAETPLLPNTSSGHPPSLSPPSVPQQGANGNPAELGPSHQNDEISRQNDVRQSGYKKWSWLRNWTQTSTETDNNTSTEVKPLQPSTATVVVRQVESTADDPSTQSETPSNDEETSKKHKPSLLKRLMKRRLKKSPPQEFPIDPQPTDSSQTATSPADRASSTDTRNTEKPLPRLPHAQGKNQNVFARLFQFKPATRVVALNTSKMKGRKDVYKILRDWKQYGLEYVLLDKANSVIYAKVGEVNFPRLRPVEFSAEFCTVLEHGREANLSVIRFKQEHGAASSFHKVVDTICVVMKQRGMLVEDPARAKKMAHVLDAFPDS